MIPRITKRTVAAVLVAAALPVGVGVAAPDTPAVQASAVAAVAVILTLGVLTAYPAPLRRFALRVPTRRAYRRAGSRSWVTSAMLDLHGVSPEQAASVQQAWGEAYVLAALSDALDQVAALDADVDTDLAVALLLAHPDAEGTLLRVLDQFLILDADQRSEARSYLAAGVHPGQALPSLRDRLPFALARRALDHTASTRMGAVVLARLRGIWRHPDTVAALGHGQPSGPGGQVVVDPARVASAAERLHEWADADPAFLFGLGHTIAEAAQGIRDYQEVPLAGWWRAAGYGPQEAAHAAAGHDWSRSQLVALAALRRGPVVTDRTDLSA